MKAQCRTTIAPKAKGKCSRVAFAPQGAAEGRTRFGAAPATVWGPACTDWVHAKHYALPHALPHDLQRRCESGEIACIYQGLFGEGHGSMMTPTDNRKVLASTF